MSEVAQLPEEQSIILNSPTVMSLLFCTVWVTIHPMVPNPDRNMASPMYWNTKPILAHFDALPQYAIFGV